MLTCDQHDYIEIACTYRFSVLLTLHDGTTLAGIAKDTAYNDDKKECIVIESNNDDRLITLESVQSMKALTVNPHFDIVDFS